MYSISLGVCVATLYQLPIENNYPGWNLSLFLFNELSEWHCFYKNSRESWESWESLYCIPSSLAESVFGQPEALISQNSPKTDEV